MTVYIGIDCAPGTPRPDSYVQEACSAYGFEYDGTEPSSKLFGAWQWFFTLLDEDYDIVKNNEPNLAEYMERLYTSYKIRGAEWSVNKD